MPSLCVWYAFHAARYILVSLKAMMWLTQLKVPRASMTFKMKNSSQLVSANTLITESRSFLNKHFVLFEMSRFGGIMNTKQLKFQALRE